MVKGKFQAYLPSKGGSWTYSCLHCRAHLACHADLISKSFQGSHGRAYLFNHVVNVTRSEAKQRALLTGIHYVADVFCACCQTTLGWKYERAVEASQRYKEGKVILELAHLIKDNGWDSVWLSLPVWPKISERKTQMSRPRPNELSTIRRLEDPVHAFKTGLETSSPDVSPLPNDSCHLLNLFPRAFSPKFYARLDDFPCNPTSSSVYPMATSSHDNPFQEVIDLESTNQISVIRASPSPSAPQDSGLQPGRTLEAFRTPEFLANQSTKKRITIHSPLTTRFATLGTRRGRVNRRCMLLPRRASSSSPSRACLLPLIGTEDVDTSTESLKDSVADQIPDAPGQHEPHSGGAGLCT